MSIYTPQPIFSKPLFQRSLIFLIIFLILAALFVLLGFGRPNLAVVIALDLSTSTHDGKWNGQGTVMAKEIEAVNAYLDLNLKLSNPNQIQVLGFGDVVEKLAPSFQSDSSQVKKDFTESLTKPDIRSKFIASGTNLSLVISESVSNLKEVGDRCRQMLLVTDGDANINPEVIADAVANKVKVNSVIVGAESPAVLAVTLATGGTYNSSLVGDLSLLFTDKIFSGFNSNIRWVIFWLGCAWVALMWLLVHHLDLFFQKFLGIGFSLAGKLALSNALFWTFSTIGIVWRITNGFVFLSQC